MQFKHGNKTATGGAMNITPCTVRGEVRWKIELPGGGKRKRQFFPNEAAAQKALKDALKDHADLGRAWGKLSAREKAEIMGILKEIQDAGMTLRQLWESSRKMPAAPKLSRTLGEVRDEVLAAKRQISAGLSKRHIKNMDWYLGLFAKGRETLPIASITEVELEGWFTDRNESPIARKTHRALLSIMFTYAFRKRYITDNPVKRLESVKVKYKIPAVLTFGQSRKALLWACSRAPKFLAWLVTTLFIGLRPESEADTIEWDWKKIDLEHDCITVEDGKTGFRIIELSLCPPVVPWLKVCKAINSPLNLPFGTRRRYMRKLRDYLGFKRWPQDILRHTAASNLLAVHQASEKIAIYMGNEEGILLKKYRGRIFKRDAERFMALLPKPRHFAPVKIDIGWLSCMFSLASKRKPPQS
jgi:hypothetical protein